MDRCVPGTILQMYDVSALAHVPEIGHLPQTASVPVWKTVGSDGQGVACSCRNGHSLLCLNHKLHPSLPKGPTVACQFQCINEISGARHTQEVIFAAAIRL